MLDEREGGQGSQSFLSSDHWQHENQWAQMKRHEFPSEHRQARPDSEGVHTWWNASHGWSAGMEGYRLFRSSRQGRRVGGCTLHTRERFDCTALTISDDVVESLWLQV